ncbi:hypothetical protein V7056_19670 [Bacillus sp. JJ664]
MFETINWRMFIDAKSKEKANKVVKTLTQVIGEIEILSLERYWKDQTKFELVCKTKLEVKESEKAVFNALVIANQIAQEIYVIGPTLYEGNQIEFEGMSSSPKIVGISWFHFYIEN